MEDLIHDLRYGLRMLRATPAFTAAALLSLALGIGASTAVFSIADTIFLRPLPYPQPQQLVWVAIQFRNHAQYLPSPDYVAWRRTNRVFGQLAAVAPGSFPMVATNLTGTNSGPLAANAKRVSANFLEALGVKPALGRSFSLQEEAPNGSKSVILADRFWRAEFAARRDVIGRPITLDGQPYTIAGVLPASFLFPFEGPFDLLTTLAISPTATHHDRAMMVWEVIGRLRPGVTLVRARANVETLFAASKGDAPSMFGSDTRPAVETLQHHRVGNSRLLLLVLTGAVACLLLIACANLANLLLARWSVRTRELALRAAMGAARYRLMRQLLTEAGLLTFCGGALGMAVVVLALRGFVHFAKNELPRLSEVTLDARVFGIALFVSILTAILFGALPALRAGRVDVNAVLQQAGRPGVAAGFTLLRRALVAAEVALSLVLLSAAALLLQTLWHLENDRLGFEPEHTLSLSVSLKGTRFEKTNHELLADTLLAYARRLPGTQAAALGVCQPPAGIYMVSSFSRSDRPLPEPFHRGDNIASCGAGVDYFKAVGTPLLQGRTFTDEDFRHPDTLAVINETAARSYFPGENPLGKQIGGDREGHWKTVIGIVGDAKNQGLDKPALPEMFTNNLELEKFFELDLILRTIAQERAVEADLRAELRSLDAALFPDFATLEEGIKTFTAGPRFNSMLLASFAAIALLLAVIGVYGVLAFAVAQRTHEIGIRLALGATPQRVLAAVMREGVLLLALGTAAGLVGALLLTRYLKALLYDVRATDPMTYLAVIVALAMAASIAMFLPARRAASVDPMLALRHE